MPKLALYGAAGGVFLALGAGAAFQTWRLGNAQEALGEARERVKLCRDANAGNRETIEQLRTRLEMAVRDRELHAERVSEALEALERERAETASDRDAALAELEALYEGDCEAWAAVPVCAGVARRLRQ